ncbi:unnamed protein product [Durusdinium trenchii]
MRGALSRNPLCRRFYLEPRVMKEHMRLRGSVVLLAFAGAKRVLGSPDPGWEEVRVVAATQTWAKASVPPLRSLLLPYGHLHLAQVAQLLASFESAVALKAEFGLSSIPQDAIPSDWRPRPLEDADVSPPIKRKAEAMNHFKMSNELLSTKQEKGQKETKKMPGEKAASVKMPDKALKKAVSSNEEATCTKNSKKKSFGKEAASLKNSTKGSEKRSCRKEVVKAADKSTSKKVPMSKKLLEKTEAASKTKSKRGFNKMPFSEKPLKEEEVANAKKAKISEKTHLAKKENAKRSQAEGEVKPSGRCTKQKPSTSSCEKGRHADISKAPTGQACGRAAKDHSSDRVCNICGGPSSCAPKSCERCTADLAKRRGLRFVVNDLVWCSGFGPRWPAEVAALGFDGPQDSNPYAVKFLGESTGAWVSEARMEPWAHKKAPSVAPRWQRRMKVALEAAERRLSK